jgi:hypothetical protein
MENQRTLSLDFAAGEKGVRLEIFFLERPNRLLASDYKVP